MRRALRTKVQSQQGVNGRPRISHTGGVVAWEELAPGKGCKALGPAWSRLDSTLLLAVELGEQVTFRVYISNGSLHCSPGWANT